MKTVKAARIHNYDGAKALRFEGTTVPEPQSGEVLVDVLSVEPRRLLVMRDAASGWADLGNPDRVVNTLVQNQIEPEWLLKMRGSVYYKQPNATSPSGRHDCSVAWCAE